MIHHVTDTERQLEAEIKRLRKDAERYRWLLSVCGFGIRRNGVTELTVCFYKDSPDNIVDLDAAIDAAMNHHVTDTERQQAAEIERLRKDAERYRWLRDHASGADWEHFGYQDCVYIDAAIDAAMKEQP